MWPISILLLLAGVASAQPASIGAFGYAGPDLVSVAPGQIVTLYLQGVQPRLDRIFRAQTLPLPKSVGGISVILRQSIDGYSTPIAAPILSLRSVAAGCDPSTPQLTHYFIICAGQITIQIPYELVPGSQVAGSLIATSLRAALIVSENGLEGLPIPVLPVFDQVHAVNPCDAMFVGNPASPENSCGVAVTHADGSRVTHAKPARQLESVTMYALGLGLTWPPASTGERAKRAAVVSPDRFKLGATFAVNAPAMPTVNPVTGAALPSQMLIKPNYLGLVEGYVGLYQINFTVPQLPPETISCDARTSFDTNVTVSIGTVNGYSGGDICVTR